MLKQSYVDYQEEGKSRCSDFPETNIIICVNIGDGVERELLMNLNDDPSELAKSFCNLHKLPQETHPQLTTHIIEALKSFKHPLKNIEALKLLLLTQFQMLRLRKQHSSPQ